MPVPEGSESKTWRMSPDLLGFVDLGGVFFETNPAWQIVLGWSVDEIRSKTFVDFLHPDDMDSTLAVFEDMKQGGTALHFENRYQCKDGSYRWLSWVAAQEADVFFCSARDVTADKEHLLSLRTHEDEALLREQFVAILGHDLRNPLAAIGSAVRIASDHDHSETIGQMLTSIEGSANRMAQLIDVTMDFARARLGGGIPVTMLPTDSLTKEFEQVVGEIRLTHPDREIELNTHIDATVVCDAARLNQMLSNLVANAVMHGSKGRAVHVDVKTANDVLEISVVNYGQQIPKAALPNLLEPFSRGEDSNSMQGLGLGLYISDQIAKAHGGDLTVASDAEKTCFSFKLALKSS